MESIFVRYRNVLVLLIILLAQIIGLAMQVRRTGEGRGTLDPGDGSGVRLIRLWAQALVSPPERLIHSTSMGSEHVWQNYIDLRNVRQQNADLQKTIDRLRLEQASLLEDAKQGQRLQALLNFQEKYIYKTVAAQAIGSSGSEQSRVFYIDKGSSSGIARDDAVITADGIVGKVRDVFPSSAQVLVINDQTSGAGVILETTRTRGILRGNANGQTEIVDILSDKRIQKGEVVLTAGGDQIFPRGLPVGVVDKVVPDPERDSFIDVMVTPAAHLNQLDEVLVITSTQPRFSDQQQKDIATSQELKGGEAAAILKQEMEQKKASYIMAERLPGLIDPNLPPDQQPLHDSSNPNPVAHPPQALHPDRFSPQADGGPAVQSVPGEPAQPGQGQPGQAQPEADQSVSPQAAKPAPSVKPAQTGHPAGNPSKPAKPAPKPQSPQRNAGQSKPERNP
jgi:rod shape-determining protein MreC